MKLILKLAWRNIWRNKRRSYITIAAIVFAAMLSVFMRGVQLGTYDVNIKTAVEMFSGYLQIQDKEFQDKQSLRKSFAFDDDIKSKLERNELVENYTARIYAGGLIGKGDNTVGAAIFGLDPVNEPKVTTIHKKVKEGQFLSADIPNGMVVGHKMLKNLNAKIGDEVVVISTGYDGSMTSMKFKIIGASKSGTNEMDAMTAFINLEAAKEMLYMENRVNVVAVSLPSLDVMNEAKQQLTNVLNNKDLRVLNWEEIMPGFKQSIEFDNSTGVIYLLFLIIIVAFGILNTIVMSITERFREFGIMLALGVKNAKLAVIVFFETIFLTFIGTGGGLALGWLANAYVAANPIYFDGDMGQMYEEYGFIPAMYSTNAPEIFISTSLTIIIIALLVYLYPARKLYKLEAMKGIRYT